MRDVEIGVRIAPAARSQFARQQPDYRQPGPLAKAKGLEQLLLCMSKGERDCIHRGNGQGAPRYGLTARYCEPQEGSN